MGALRCEHFRSLYMQKSWHINPRMIYYQRFLNNKDETGLFITSWEISEIPLTILWILIRIILVAQNLEAQRLGVRLQSHPSTRVTQVYDLNQE